MSNTGVLTPSNYPLDFQQTVSPHTPGTSIAFQASPGEVIRLNNLLTASSVRAQALTVTVTASGTQQAFAHGLVNEDGNPIAPRSLGMVAATGVYTSTQVPDTTNIYLTSLIADNTITVLLYY